jgi:hypothetical protein
VRSLLESEGYPGEISTQLDITAPANLEMDDTRPDIVLLGEIAEAVGGILAWPAAAPEIVKHWHLPPTVTESRSREPVWPRWPLFWTLIGLLAIEWTGRKLIGLV